MTPNDMEPDPELQHRLLGLSRDDPTSSTFTDRVLVDLERRGLVRPDGSRTTTRWWAAAAAAAVVFAAGIGVGTAIGGTRESSRASSPPAPATADRAGDELNVPRVGQTEVWF